MLGANVISMESQLMRMLLLTLGHWNGTDITTLQMITTQDNLLGQM